MAIDTSGPFWRGEDFNDLAEYIREFKPGGYPVIHVREWACRTCGGKTFAVDADDDQGCARTRCLACNTTEYIADSAEYADEADLVECACPCGSEAFAVGIGYALYEDQEIRWISIGLICTRDGALGVYADWKIDYTPSRHLLVDTQ